MGWAARAHYQTMTREKQRTLKELAAMSRLGTVLEWRMGKWRRPKM